jgi:hypothetical protein
MKKYTENIEALQENAKYTAIDTLLKSEISSLYRNQVTNPAFAKGGLKTGEPTAIEVLQKMKALIDKFTKEDTHGRLELKSQTEIESNS